MNITVRWQEPIPLLDGSESRENFIYRCEDLSCLPDKPGVYLFARRFGDSLTPLYVGQALSLRSRIRQQFNNVYLMRGIQNASIGGRCLILGTFALRPGQQIVTVLDVVEKALIEKFVNEGFGLLNKLGTKIRVDEVSFEGNRNICRLVGRSIKVPPRRSISREDA